MNNEQLNSNDYSTSRRKSIKTPVFTLFFLIALTFLLVIAAQNMGASGLAVLPVLILVFIVGFVDLIVLVKRLLSNRTSKSRIIGWLLSLPLWWVLSMILGSIWSNFFRCPIVGCSGPYSDTQKLLLSLERPVILGFSLLVVVLVLIIFSFKR